MVHSGLRLATAALFCATPHGAVLPNAVSRAATRPLADLSWSPSLGVNVEGVPLQQTWAFQCGDPCKPAAGGPAPPRGHAISYITAGAEKDPPLLLIHGFGASSFHWRSNVNALAQAGNRVYAIDLLGFGSSDKPLLDYDLDVWVAQCASFLREVVGCGEPIKGDNSTLAKRAVVAGNSIGGLTALALAAAEPSLVRGVATLNCAGRFSPTPAERVQAQRRKRVRDTTSPMKGFATAWSGTVDSVGAALRRVLLGGAFVVTKQPARISQARLALQIRMRDRQCLGLGREARGQMLAGRVNSQQAVVLRQVYPIRPERADADLVSSIQWPARHPNAEEVFFRIVSRTSAEPLDDNQCIDVLLGKLQMPISLVWGEYDPWIRPQVADKMQVICRKLGHPCERVSIKAGHCPQDEAPEPVNAAIADFCSRLPP